MKKTEISAIAQLSGNVSNAASMMKSLSNETRLMLMCSLMDGEKSVNQLAEAVDMRLPAVSQHLAKLRHMNLVSARRDAQNIYYNAMDGIGADVVKLLCSHYH